MQEVYYGCAVSGAGKGVMVAFLPADLSHFTSSIGPMMNVQERAPARATPAVMKNGQ